MASHKNLPGQEERDIVQEERDIVIKQSHRTSENGRGTHLPRKIMLLPKTEGSGCEQAETDVHYRPGQPGRLRICACSSSSRAS